MSERDKIQEAVFNWARRTFGMPAMMPHERAKRFLEEALELAQAEGVTAHEVVQLSNYVYARPAGTVAQEVGGVCITLLAYCESINVSADECEREEWSRVLTINPGEFRERHNAKAAAGIAVEAE